MKKFSGAVLLLSVSTTVFADGGRVRLSEKAGPYQVTIFTEPTPFRAGPVDVSVLVQDAESGQVADAVVVVRLTRDREVIVHEATREAATNKLLRAAVFDLPAAGKWVVQAEVKGNSGAASVGFAIEAGERLPRWQTLWPWIAWPIVPIALFALLQHWRWHARCTRLAGAKLGQIPGGG